MAGSVHPAVRGRIREQGLEAFWESLPLRRCGAGKQPFSAARARNGRVAVFPRDRGIGLSVQAHGPTAKAHDASGSRRKGTKPVSALQLVVSVRAPALFLSPRGGAAWTVLRPNVHKGFRYWISGFPRVSGAGAYGRVKACPTALFWPRRWLGEIRVSAVSFLHRHAGPRPRRVSSEPPLVGPACPRRYTHGLMTGATEHNGRK